jgi:NAD(P)-dependent dehydrogenase (short-subunit alcohol dehydrogenase family)
VNLELEGKRALVTGSTAGIGFAIAGGLAREGAHVIVNGRTDGRVTKAVERIRAEVAGASVEGIAADLGTADGAAKVIQACPDLDILVNNLGIYEPMAFEEISDADWLRLFEINVMSGVRLTPLSAADEGQELGARHFYFQ